MNACSRTRVWAHAYSTGARFRIKICTLKWNLPYVMFSISIIVVNSQSLLLNTRLLSLPHAVVLLWLPHHHSDLFFFYFLSVFCLPSINVPCTSTAWGKHYGNIIRVRTPVGRQGWFATRLKRKEGNRSGIIDCLSVEPHFTQSVSSSDFPSVREKEEFCMIKPWGNVLEHHRGLWKVT